MRIVRLAVAVFLAIDAYMWVCVYIHIYIFIYVFIYVYLVYISIIVNNNFNLYYYVTYIINIIPWYCISTLSSSCLCMRHVMAAFKKMLLPKCQNLDIFGTSLFIIKWSYQVMSFSLWYWILGSINMIF